MHVVVYFVLVFGGFLAVHGDESTLCSTWDGIERNLNNRVLQFSCSKDESCLRLNCSGIAHEYDVDSSIQLYPCEKSPSIEFQIDAPHLNINNFKKRIYHNDSIALTRYLNVEFHVQKENQDLVLGVFVHYFNNESIPLPYPFNSVKGSKPVINNVRFAIPSSACGIKEPVVVSKSISKPIQLLTTKSSMVVPRVNDQEHSNCTIMNSSCGEEEICQQIDTLKTNGICVCISDYKRDKDGKCIYNPAVDPEGPPDNPTPNKKKTSSESLLLTAILVPITVIVLIVGVVYASIRFRVCQHLRRRLRVQVYEHVLLGEDDEDEDLTNPVA